MPNRRVIGFIHEKTFIQDIFQDSLLYPKKLKGINRIIQNGSSWSCLLFFSSKKK